MNMKVYYKSRDSLLFLSILVYFIVNSKLNTYNKKPKRDNMNTNELLEEEIEIIEAFNHELELNGYGGFCSFSDFVDNGYYIYKENNCWLYNFNKKGVTVISKEFTNIYNLCLDILTEMKIETYSFEKGDLRIPKGTKVIISKPTDCPIDEMNLGEIVNSRLVHDKRNHAERVYEVFGDDEQLYTGLYGYKIYGDVFFRSIEDYIRDNEKELKENNDTIVSLQDLNTDITFNIEEAEGIRIRYLNENNSNTK